MILYLVVLVAAFAIPNVFGQNALRLPVLLGPPLLLLAPRAGAPRFAIAAVLVALVYLQWLPAVRAVAANCFLTTPREKILDLCVLVKRMFTTIEELFLVEEEWRDPTGIVLVDPPRQREEVLQISAIIGQGQHALPLACFVPARTLFSRVPRER